jgi:hypothetical protein
MHIIRHAVVVALFFFAVDRSSLTDCGRTDLDTSGRTVVLCIILYVSVLVKRKATEMEYMTSAQLPFQTRKEHFPSINEHVKMWLFNKH